MAQLRDSLSLTTDEPVQITLEYDQPKSGTNKNGNSYTLYGVLANGRPFGYFASPDVHAVIQGMGLKKGQTFMLTEKAHKVDGHLKAYWVLQVGPKIIDTREGTAMNQRPSPDLNLDPPMPPPGVRRPDDDLDGEIFTHTEKLIFITGVVGRSMGSGKFALELIPEITMKAIAAWDIIKSNIPNDTKESIFPSIPIPNDNDTLKNSNDNLPF